MHYVHLPEAFVEDPLQASSGSVGVVKATEQDGSMDNWWWRWKEIYATISHRITMTKKTVKNNIIINK